MTTATMNDRRRTTPWHPQARMERTSMVFSGTTTTIAGCCLSLKTNEESRTGRITCIPSPGKKSLTQVEVEAIMIDAERLRKRVLRFLGITWKVEPLSRQDVEALA